MNGRIQSRLVTRDGAFRLPEPGDPAANAKTLP